MAALSSFAPTLLLLLQQVAQTLAAPQPPRSYSVIFDCGSTGTRVHVFSWLSNNDAVGGLPDVRAEPGGYKKVTPGISSFEPNPEAAGGSLTQLLELAERVVPAPEHANTRVLLRATAGMRLLARRRAQRIYTSLYDAVAARGTFRPRREDFGTLSGEDEGVFGWLSANYLLKRTGAISELGSVGALDLGGGSTQITLATSAHASESSFIDPRLAVEAAHPQPAPQPRVPLPSGSVSVFTHSHLGFGNKAVLASMTAVEAATCLAVGASATWEPGNKSSDYRDFLNRGANEGAYLLRGKGDFDACDAAVRRVLATFDRHGQPPLRHSKPSRFVAMSLFFYVEHFVGVAGHLPEAVGTSPASPAATATATATAGGGTGGGGEGGKGGKGGVSAGMLLSAARKLCAEPDASLRRMVGRDPLTTEDALRWRCFDAVYASRLLTDGYGFGEHDASIEFLGDIDGVEVEWTLGALLNLLLHDEGSGAGGGAQPGQHAGRQGSFHGGGHHQPAAASSSTSPLLAIGAFAAAALGLYYARTAQCYRLCSPARTHVRLISEKEGWP